jgi:uncharacterized protein
MSISSRIFGTIFKLPPAVTYNIVVERDIQVPMPDGIVLSADRYYPRGSSKLPTVLVRCPYGRNGLYALRPRILAERGLQVLLQSCRGTFGSGGQFIPFHNERTDGLATVEWMKKQAWFSGEFAIQGPSYMGLAAWAIARNAGPGLKTIDAQITASNFRGGFYYGESFSLFSSLAWLKTIATQEKTSPGPLSVFFPFRQYSTRDLDITCNHLPLNTCDQALIGKTVQSWQDWLEHNEPGDEWWKPIDYSETVAEVTAPVNLIGGWYDLWIPWMLKDYCVLRKAGHSPHLLVGPWSHLKTGGESVSESISWLRAHLLGDRSRLREKPVRLFVMGAGEWRDFPDWPPPGYQPQKWYLRENGNLSTESPSESEPDHFRYDPADPTPCVGGPILSLNAGPKDNRRLEMRSDVLVFTSEILRNNLEVVGPVSAELFVKSSLENTDFFVRLCDVHPSGKSINICDGIRRLSHGHPQAEKDTTIKVEIEMWPTAYRFIRGHRIRIQVSSGAHPILARNLGSGEPLGTGTKLVPADQTVYHDQTHPSAIYLPVLK